MSEDLLEVSGGCYCGGVRFRAKGVKPQVTECHCSQCRKQSGHRFASTGAKTSDMEIEGEDIHVVVHVTRNKREAICAYESAVAISRCWPSMERTAR